MQSPVIRVIDGDMKSTLSLSISKLHLSRDFLFLKFLNANLVHYKIL